MFSTHFCLTITDSGSQILLELDEVGQNELTASRVPQSSAQSRAASPAVGHSAIHLPGSAAPAPPPDMAPSPLAMTNGNSNVSVQGLWGFQQDHNSADLLFWNEMPISVCLALTVARYTLTLFTDGSIGVDSVHQQLFIAA